MIYKYLNTKIKIIYLNNKNSRYYSKFVADLSARYEILNKLNLYKLKLHDFFYINNIQKYSCNIMENYNNFKNLNITDLTLIFLDNYNYTNTFNYIENNKYIKNYHIKSDFLCDNNFCIHIKKLLILNRIDNIIIRNTLQYNDQINIYQHRYKSNKAKMIKYFKDSLKYNYNIRKFTFNKQILRNYHNIKFIDNFIKYDLTINYNKIL